MPPHLKLKSQLSSLRTRRWTTFLLASLAILLANAGLTVAQEQVDFSHQVVPILKEHCAKCHAGDESKGGFSINRRGLFLDSGMAEPGNPEGSYFLELIDSSDPNTQMPPPEEARVPADKIAVLRQWVDQGMSWENGFTFGGTSWEPPLKPRRPDLPPAVAERKHPIDRLVDHWLTLNKLDPPQPLGDAAFLRRVSLDLTGLLPTSERVRSFLADKSPEKRQHLIEELLQDDLAYSEHWLTFWNDLLRNDYDGTGFITKGRTQISEWLYESLLTNKPFDAMVRELISPPDERSAGFINGIQWRGTVSAGQTLPIQFSQSLSQSFLGINMKCASCHDSFIDRWTLQDAYGLAAIYADGPLALHRCDKPTGEVATAAWMFPEIGQVDADAPRDQRLKQLAELMTHADNGRVPRTIVNRLWGQLMGRGIIHPLDAMQSPPWSEDLLDWLAFDFQKHGYDLKHTLRQIVTSSAYQSQSTHADSKAETSDYVYRGPVPKRMTAEQFVDAVWQVTGTAPDDWDAPIQRGRPDLPTHPLSMETPWIWAKSGNPTSAAPNEKILLRRDFSPARPLRAAGMVATADNSYELFLNGKLLLSGNQWTQVDASTITKAVQSRNTLLMVAQNGGTQPNPAGAFCAVHLIYEDGTDEVFTTDERWQLSREVPSGKRVERWKLEGLPWEQPAVVDNNPWLGQTESKIVSSLAKASSNTDRQVRASLLKADDLMRALGRPNRDQIVTSRPAELTTLEAVNLSTSQSLLANLLAGGRQLAEQYKTSALVDEVYLATLTRFPTPEERLLAESFLGNQPEAEPVCDLLWAITMTPEFLIIR